MIRCLRHIAAAVLLGMTLAASAKTPQKEYIRTYSVLAVQEMYRSGVPASITLAQGMLESGNGLSELALKGNNHFGIKCHSGWKGDSIYHDDDRKGECFRKYKDVELSYRDHSDFLRYRDRYKFLFDLDVTDYKGWANGLKKAGYATDPSYPKKLIKLIEEYKLYEYDVKPYTYGQQPLKTEQPSRPEKPSRKPDRKEPVTAPVAPPKSPYQMEQPKRATESQREYFHFPVSRELYSQNGVPFVYSLEGETYKSIAKAYGLFFKEILKINDLDSDEPLRPGTVVYLQAKKKKAAKGKEMHFIDNGESLRDISQRYAVRLSAIYKINGLHPAFVARNGDCIRLRK
jgi:LysM repeat protein